MAFLSFVLATMLALAAEATILKQQGFYQGDIEVKRTRNGILASQRWTNGVIPYMFNTSSFQNWTQENVDMAMKAMKEIMDHSCIKFRPKTNTDKNFISIVNGRGCSSAVGMYEGGHQYVSLTEYGCWSHSTVVHELMHAIGLWHEQSRYDRDQYLNINLQNVEDWAKYNFDQKFPNESDTYNVPYNYRSVMQYDKLSFTKNGRITIEPKDPQMVDTIGTVPHGAESDYEKIRRIYQCKGNFPRMPEAPIVPPKACANEYGDSYCNDYLHECSSKRWAWSGCRKACGLCSSTGSPGTVAPTVAPPTGNCQDKAATSECENRKDTCSHEAMEYWCPKTCKYC